MASNIGTFIMDIYTIFTKAIADLILNQPLMTGLLLAYLLFAFLGFLMKLCKKVMLATNRFFLSNSK